MSTSASLLSFLLVAVSFALHNQNASAQSRPSQSAAPNSEQQGSGPELAGGNWDADVAFFTAVQRDAFDATRQGEWAYHSDPI